MPEDTYTSSQVARILSLTDRRVRQMLEAGELKGEKEEEAGRWKVYRWSVHARRERQTAHEEMYEGWYLHMEAEE